MPEQLLARFAEVFPVGVASGLLAGMFGVGGGVLSVPLMRHILGASAHVAVGSSLAVIFPTAFVALINYLRKGRLLVPLALASGIPAMATTLVGSAASHAIHGSYLMFGLCLVMLLVGLDFVTGFGKRISGQATTPAEGEEQFEVNREVLVRAALLGCTVGVVSGLIGIGGGFLLVPGYLYFFRLPVKSAFGTSLLVISGVSLPGAFVHSLHEHVDMSLVVPMLAGSLPGAWLGSLVANRTRDRALKATFGAILILMSGVCAYRELP